MQRIGEVLDVITRVLVVIVLVICVFVGLSLIGQLVSPEIATLILEYIKALAWPVSALTVIYLIRHQLPALLKDRNVSVRTPGGGEVTLSIPHQTTPEDTVSGPIKEEIERTVEAKEQTDTPTPANTELATFKTALLFERTYNAIFGSQISILVNLRNNIEGLWYVVLSNYYESLKVNDELLKNYPFQNYLGFLESSGLITPMETPTGRKYLITDMGIDFLNYIEKSGYPMMKPH